jgi:hypothetical protein
METTEFFNVAEVQKAINHISKHRKDLKLQALSRPTTFYLTIGMQTLSITLNRLK